VHAFFHALYNLEDIAAKQLSDELPLLIVRRLYSDRE
jgi:hypothetical protein